nr:uncharacterized protein LOC109180701 [Ipomoea batatas]
MGNLKDVAYLVVVVVVVLVFGVELVQADSPCTRVCPKECLHQKSQDPAACYFSCVQRCTKGEDAQTPVPQGMKEEAIGKPVPSETKNTIPTKDTGILKNLIISSYDTKAPKDTAAAKQH